MKIKILSLLAITLTYAVRAQTLSDNFGGTSVDTSLWQVTLPENDSSVTEANGYVSLENAGRLTTVASMPTDYEIAGTFLMANNPFSNFKVMLRTDGVSLPPPNAPGVYGIEVQLNIQDDPAGGGSTMDNLKIYADSPSGGNLIGIGSPTANLTLNTWHSFLITDDGTNIKLFFDGSSAPNLSATSTYSAGTHVSLLNREGAGNGSTISANGITEIDSITITQVPEPCALALMTVGLIGLVGFRNGR